MNYTSFIAAKLRFKGKMAMVSIAVSFLVMIVAVAISAGFRKEIRRGVSSFCGDVQVTNINMDYLSGETSITASPELYEAINEVKGVKEVNPVLYRAGIVRTGDDMHGVIFKAIPSESDSASLIVSIPSALARKSGLDVGDDMMAYFVGENVRARRFKVGSIYKSMLDLDETMLIYASAADLQRLNGWSEGEYSALEVTLDDRYKGQTDIEWKSREVGMSVPEYLAGSVVQKYPELFDWLDLIDFNVVFILILMTIVAGFNMISGLLILLFQNISTIGILKSMGMTDKSISKVFLKVSSNLILKGMAIGNGIALFFCLLQHLTHIIRLNPENYFVSYVPVSVNIQTIIAADIVAYVLIMLLLLIPCKFISKVDPAKTVRTN